MADERAGTPITAKQCNVLGECPACGNKIGETHRPWCDAAYAELREYNRYVALHGAPDS